MIKTFKHTFIPHEQNDYKPHFFREKSITVILVLAIFLLAISFGTTYYIKSKNLISTVLPAVLVDLTNEEREKEGQLALAKSDLLTEAAKLKAEDMSANNYFAHNSPAGITPWHWFSKVGYTFIYAGENLAIDFTESLDVEKAWLRSPTHKANILNTKFSEIGIATKEGFYNGHPTIYVVQMFGTPAFASQIKEDVSTKEAVSQEKEEVKKEIVPLKKDINKPEVIALNEALPLVKGEQVSIEESIETISESPSFISVKNTSITEESIQNVVKEEVKYANGFQKTIFKIPGYTERFYEIFVWIILLALLSMMFIQIRRQHPKNIIYGILIIIIIFCFIYLNHSLFVNSFLV